MRVPKRKTNKARVKQWLTFDLLPLNLEVPAHGLDRQLEALDGLTLLPEGHLLIGVGDAEHNHLALGLGELGVSSRQGLLRHLVGCALLLQRCTGVDEGGLLLLKPLLSPLAGGALLQEPLLSGDKGRGLGVKGGLQVVGLLGALLQPARPLLSLTLLRLRPLERRAELPGLATNVGHLRLPVGGQRPRLLQIRAHMPQRLITIDEGCADPLEARATRRVLPRALGELVRPGQGPVRQPAVRRPKGVSKRVESAAPLPELVDLGVHPVERIILVVGAALELLTSAHRDP
jgi:hypothetical protein